MSLFSLSVNQTNTQTPPNSKQSMGSQASPSLANEHPAGWKRISEDILKHKPAVDFVTGIHITYVAWKSPS